MQSLSDAIPITLWSPVQGLIVDKVPTQIPPTACQACNNMVGFDGKLRRRAGWVAILDTLPAGYAVNKHTARFSLDGTSTRVVIARKISDNTGKFFYWDGATWIDATASIVFSCSDTLRTQADCLNGILYFATGVSDLLQWDGTALQYVTNANAAVVPFNLPQSVLAWDNRLWNANVVDQTSGSVLVSQRTAWSNFQDPTTWGVVAPYSGSAGFQDIEDTTYTAPIIGLRDTRDYLFAFQAEATYYGQATSNIFYEFRRLSRGKGLASQDTLKRFQESLFWLGNENVFACADQQTISPIADSIRPRILQVCDQTKFNLAMATMDPINQLYWLFLPSNGSSQVMHVFIFSIRDNAWWEGELAQGTAINPECTFEYRTGAWQVEVSIGSQDGKIYQMEGYPATALDGLASFLPTWRSQRMDATAIGASYQSRLQGSKGPFETMSLQRFGAHATSGKVTVRPYYGSGAHNMTAGKPVSVSFTRKSDSFATFDQDTDRYVELELSFPDITNAPEIQGIHTHFMPGGQVPRGATR